MWDKMTKDTGNKKRINQLAVTLLGPRMPKLCNKLMKFVPLPPVNEENETLWLLQPNSFNLTQAHERFLLLEDKMDNCANLQCIKAISCSTSWVILFSSNFNLT